MKKIILIIISILFFGCSFTYEDDENIRMTMTQSNSEIKVIKDSGYYVYSNPSYNFTLETYDGEIKFSKALLKYNGRVDRIDNIDFFLKPSEQKNLILEINNNLLNEVIEKSEINLVIEFYFDSTTSLSKIEKRIDTSLKLTYEEVDTIIDIVSIQNIKNIVKEKEELNIEDTVKIDIGLNSTSYKFLKLNQVKANGINIFCPELTLQSGNIKSIDLFLRDIIDTGFLEQIQLVKYKIIYLELEFTSEDNQLITSINTQIQYNFSEIIEEDEEEPIEEEPIEVGL